jgi:hypothetical protein
LSSQTRVDRIGKSARIASTSKLGRSILTAVDVLCDSLKPKPPLTEAVTFYEYEDVQIYWRTWEAPREYPTGRTITILPNPEWDETMRCWRGTYELREES